MKKLFFVFVVLLTSSCDTGEVANNLTSGGDSCEQKSGAKNLKSEHREILKVAGWLDFVEKNVGVINYMDNELVAENAIGRAYCGKCYTDIATKNRDAVGIVATIVHEAGHLADECKNGEEPAVKAHKQFYEDYEKNYSTRFYDVQPDIVNCYEGKLKDSEKQLLLKKINEVRSLHGLKSVQYSYTDDVYSSKAALMIVANNDYKFTETSKCYSWEGMRGYTWRWENSSNIQFGFITSYLYPPNDANLLAVNLFQDWNGQDSSVWKRRNLLDPQLSYISFGRVDGKPLVGDNPSYRSDMVIDFYANRGEYMQLSEDFIAYPYHNYPSELLKEDSYLSFSPIIDKGSFWNNGNTDSDKRIDLSNSKIEVYNAKTGMKEIVQDIGFYHDWIPYVIKWKMNLQKDVQYNVKVFDVKILGINRNYDYWFKLN